MRRAAMRGPGDFRKKTYKDFSMCTAGFQPYLQGLILAVCLAFGAGSGALPPWSRAQLATSALTKGLSD